MYPINVFKKPRSVWVILSLNISIFSSCNFLITALDRLFLPTSITNFVPLNKLKFNEESKFFFCGT